MPLVWIGLVLVLLKFFEVGPFATVGWLWILVPLGVAFVFFEIIEPMFGLDKKKAHDELAKAKERRVKEQLERDRKRVR
ncbi:MAG TPA: TIGR04438 family Trp-rich protein [Burkholderiaceae bacterium]|nr:TIGR04438 family Trp-rich protein [Burkholderiaceae bacterium]